MATELTDEAIVARLAVGDTRAFPELVERYRRRIFAVLVRATGRVDEAEDLFQDTWIRVARGARGFDPTRSFASWVGRIATNVAIDWMRASRSRGIATPADPETVTSEAPTPAESLLAVAERARVAGALASLPERMREAVLLRYFGGLSEQAMSEQLGVAKGTVKSRLSNAIAALRRTLDQETTDA
jgi:RNA polymerase sigma-70 factor (ECF subfamily)